MFPGPAGDLDDERVCHETVGVRGESSRGPGGGKAGKSLCCEGKRPSAAGAWWARTRWARGPRWPCKELGFYSKSNGRSVKGFIRGVIWINLCFKKTLGCWLEVRKESSQAVTIVQFRRGWRLGLSSWH